LTKKQTMWTKLLFCQSSLQSRGC